MKQYPFPNLGTCCSLALAIMCKGREVTPPAMYSSSLRASRLASYIHHLNEVGYRGLIRSCRLPSSSHCIEAIPFNGYSLAPHVIAEMGEQGQKWADEVLAELHFNVDTCDIAKWDDVNAEKIDISDTPAEGPPKHCEPFCSAHPACLCGRS